MESIFIASHRPLLPDIAEVFRARGEEVVLFDTQLQLPGDGDRVRFEIRDERSDVEKPVPPLDAPWRAEGGGQVHLLEMFYWRWERCKELALVIARAFDVWIDDNACFEDTGDAFVRQCEEHPDWVVWDTGTARSTGHGMGYYDQPHRDDHWLGTDARGQVACFATRGRGPVPHSYAWLPAAHARAIEALRLLVPTSAVRGEAVHRAGGERDAWARGFAERGVHVYEAHPVESSYRRLAAPASPASVRDLPFAVAHPTRMSCWEHLRFGEDEAIPFELLADGFV